MSRYSVIPAQAGIHLDFEFLSILKWIASFHLRWNACEMLTPACAGMTDFKKLFNKFKLLVFFLSFFLAAQLAFAALVEIPALSTRVTDLTSTLSLAEKSNLEAKLKAFEETKGSQIAVLIVPSTKPEEIEQYSHRVVTKWKLGRKNVDDALLVMIAKDDHKMRIEVDGGLQGAVPDIYAKQIVRDVIAPYFKQNDYAGGISAGLDSLIKLVDGEALPAPEKKANSGIGAGNLLPLLLFGGLISGLMLRSMFGTFFGSVLNGGLVGGIMFMFGTAILGAAAFGVMAFIATLMLGAQSAGGYRTGGYGGGWSSSGGDWGSSSGSNDTFSGGGSDGWSGGGASGDW